ncbi:MAG: hypothetical protein JO289_19820 [Xanthobacteraceae bacterium]|nr:hypothetical protein [Xanthobacteraceae bacterium]
MDFLVLTVWLVWAAFLAGSIIVTVYYAERYLQYLNKLHELGHEQLQHNKQELENLSSIQRLLGEIWSEQTKQGAKASETHSLVSNISQFSMRSAGNLQNLKEIGLRQEIHNGQELEKLSDIQRLWSEQRGRGGPRLPLHGPGYRPRLNGPRAYSPAK